MIVTIELPDRAEVVSATVVMSGFTQNTVYTHNFIPKDGDTVAIMPEKPNEKKEGEE